MKESKDIRVMIVEKYPTFNQRLLLILEQMEKIQEKIYINAAYIKRFLDER
jgi:hypothetical protein